MKRYINILLTTALAIGAVSCSKESPFESGESGNGYGRVLTSSLAVQLAGEQTRAGSVPDVKDFTVEFFKTSDMSTAAVSYKYSDMPEIVTLPAGTSYKVVAHYGENKSADWNAPYYKGESSEFDVKVDKIVDNLDPITCKLSNVKVSINFDQSLVSVMDGNSQVTVKVGESGSLNFTKDTKDSGYFAYVEGSNTLTATFTGVVDEVATTEVKTYSDVKPGTHYNITFRLHNPNAAGNGSVTVPGDDSSNKALVVDAAVSIDAVGGENGVDVSPSQEIILEDESERPAEGTDPTDPDDPNGGDDPNNPDTPDNPVTGSGPTVTPYIPEDTEGTTLVDLNAVNKADGLICAFNVDSSSADGFTQFEVDIISESLTPEELGGIGLAQHLDLANTPADKVAALNGLGFPTNVKGLAHADFDITNFMPMLKVVGEGKEHKFVLTISDGNGTTVIELRIQC